MQKDHEGKFHPCGFISATLNPAEQNYEIYDRELLALIRGLNEWRLYLENAENTVTVFTDHQNLQYFATKRDLKPRQARWSIIVSQYKLQLVHRPGKQMIQSDALSRRADAEESKVEKRMQTLLPPDLFIRIIETEIDKVLSKAEQLEYDPGPLQHLNELLQEGTTNDPDWTIVWKHKKPILLRRGRKYIPNNLEARRKAFHEAHDHPLSGHPGAATTYLNMERSYWWPGMATATRRYVKGCLKCQQNKIDRRPWKGPLQPIPTSAETRPFSRISMDLLTDLPESEQGFNTILVVADHGLTKGVILIPTWKTADSTTIATLLIDHVFKRFGSPTQIISDRDPRFTSKIFKEWERILQIRPALSTAYHPQTDGTTERFMQEIEAYLSIYCLANLTEWADALPIVEFVHNSRPHADRKQTPFELIMGYQPPAFIQQLENTNVPYWEERMTKLKEWRQDAIFAHSIAAERMSKRINGPLPTFHEGQQVWLDTRNFRTFYNKKIRPKREGPFKILTKLGKVSYKLDLPKTWKIHNVFHPIHFKPFVQTEEYGQARRPLPPILVDQEEQYEVDHIIRHRKFGRTTKYLVAWKGYGPEHNTWEPETNLKNAKETLEEYKRTHQN
jgi:transposase InsO family protein